jgi:hypothetical protein
MLLSNDAENLRVRSTFARRVFLAVFLHLCFDALGDGIKGREFVSFPSAAEVFL